MIAAKRKRQLALGCYACDVIGESLIDSRHRDGLAKLANVLVLLLRLASERCNLRLQFEVVLDLPAQLLELRRQTGLDQCARTLVNARARLSSGESIREDLLSAIGQNRSS